MRLGYRLSFALIGATFLVNAIYGYIVIHEENRDLQKGLRHETWLIAATLQPAVEYALARDDRAQAQELLDGLGHQRILGSAVIGPDGMVLLRSQGMPDVEPLPGPDPSRVLADLAPQHAFVQLDGQRIFAFAVPLLDLQGKPKAVLTVYHFTRYLREGVRRELRGLLLSLVTGIVVTAVLVIVIVNKAVSRPIGRLMRKVTALRRGDFPPGAPEPDQELDPEWPDHGDEAEAEVAAAPEPDRERVRGDELRRLSAEFDHMASDLARSREALIAEAEKRLEVERGLRRFDRMATLGQLTSNLAHEVGTPLGVLRGRAEFLAGEVAGHPEARREVEIIIQQIDRITRTIERFLSAARMSSPSSERIVGDDLVRETAALVDLECRRQGIHLHVDAASGGAAVLGQRDGLMQVLLNLAVNGIQAMERGGELRLASRGARLRGSPALELSVADTGGGIPPEERRRIFEPFYSTRGTTGLGLFISRSIVREHGGITTLESEPGQGTTFRVVLPILDGQPVETASGANGATAADGHGADGPRHAGTNGGGTGGWPAES
jgi:signal transduction histidine kinase